MDLTEGVKLDGEKTRFDLIPAGPLDQLAQVYTYGAKKYADHNWRKGIKWSRVFAAAMRHMWAFWRGEELDEESGLPHLAHAAFGCFALLEYRHTRREFDDRYDHAKPPQAIPGPVPHEQLYFGGLLGCSTTPSKPSGLCG